MSVQKPNVTDNDQISASGDFESSLQKLKTTVEELERGNLNLEESLRKYREASNLAKICNSQLTAVEEQLKIIAAEFEQSL